MPDSLHDLIAHSAPERGGKPQSIYDHLRNVADLASSFADPFGSAVFARWLGWWHDAGKVHPDIQAYLRGEGESEDHSSVGMLKAEEVMHPLAFNVAGHHGGLSDHRSLRDRVRRKRKEERILQALERADSLLDGVAPSLSEDDLPEFLRQGGSEKEVKRRYEFWLRMLHSALVDADCLDTERHFNPERFETRVVEESVGDLWERFADDQRELIERADRTEVNRERIRVYEACVAAGKGDPGFYSLSVPTGGGKTRSEMGFALQHARTHGLDRVVVALPYTSIIEQNADVYRRIFGDHVVLEHHSGVHADVEPGDESDEERWRRLAAQNWDVPVVVTTTVQLLESLFARQNSRVRKLHNLANSVVVLDEVQTLPPRLLEATLEGLRMLVDHYGTTVLLSTATQPALAKRPGFPGLRGVTEIVPDPERLYHTLRRVEYDLRVTDSWSWDQVANELWGVDQGMVVLNTIKDAESVLGALPDDESVMHLSTRLCAAHRRRVLTEVRRRLKEEGPIHLVATQVVEAGVDISFPRVLRALGPLDRLIQAAGRCNREGEQDTGYVTIFEPAGGSAPLGAYKTGRDITANLIEHDPELDLHAPDTPRRYFAALYSSRNLDDENVQSLRERFQFEQVADAYRLIKDDTTPVVVDYGRGWDILNDVVQRAEHAGFVHRDDWRRLQPYTVSLYDHVMEEARGRGDVREVGPDLWRWDGGYDEGTLHLGRYEGGRGLHSEGPSAGDLVL